MLARLIDVVLSIPFLLVAIALVSITGPSLGVTVLVIGFFSWASVGRIVRGQVLSLREREFVEAARSLGASDRRIMFVDILPNVLAQVIVYASLLIPVVIVVEATLSFLGLGLAPPTADWGGMISESQNYYTTAWWFVVFPGAALLVTTPGLQPLRRRGARRVRPPQRPTHPLGRGVVLRFLVRRIALGILVMWLITVAVFALFFIAPNDVARTLAGRQATPQTVALIAHRLGLDQSIWKQYLDFIGRLLRGDLGFDYYHQIPVSQIIGAAIPITLSVVIGGAIIWLVLGVFNGVVSAVRPRSFVDRSLTVFSLFFYSMPTFLLGLLLLYFLYFRLTLAGHDIFPAGGYAPLSDGPGQWFLHMVLPWFTLALVSAATYTRLTRASMLDVLGEDYVRTARSKGISERRVVMRHAFRAAMTPIVTQFGIDVGALIGGVVVTETVFSLPGLGKTAIDAINLQDLPVIIGIVLFASAAVVVANIVVDLVYAVLDPRVRLH